MSNSFTAYELERVWIKRFIKSFGTPIRSQLEKAYFRFHVGATQINLSESQAVKIVEGPLKLLITVDTVEQFAFLTRKYTALRYRIKKTAPTIRTLIIVHLPSGEKVPTKHKGLFLITTPNGGDCRLVDIPLGKFADGFYPIENECATIPLDLLMELFGDDEVSK